MLPGVSGAASNALLSALRLRLRVRAEIEGLGLTPGQFAPLSHGKTHYILLGEEDAPLVVLFHVGVPPAESRSPCLNVGPVVCDSAGLRRLLL